MSRTPRAAVLCLLFLAPLLAGCQGPQQEQTTTTTTTSKEAEPAGLLKIPGPTDFAITTFILLPTESGQRLVAYGASRLANEIPYIGIYDATTGRWTSAQVSNLLSDITRAYGAVAPDGTIMVALQLDTEPQGFEPFTNVARFDGSKWTVEDAPTRWLRYEAHGIVTMGDRTYALVGEHSVGGGTQELWHTDDHGATWLLDPPLPIPTGPAWLSGNATHLHICAQDEQANVVLLSRRPADLTYSSEVAWPSPSPVLVGGLHCVMSSPPGRPPVLAWDELPLALNDDHPIDETRTAMKVGTWRVEQLGEKVVDAEQLVNSTGGNLVYVRDRSLWRHAQGSWSPCPETPENHGAAVPYALVTWGSQPVLASFYYLPVPTGTIYLRPLDPTVPDCLARA